MLPLIKEALKKYKVRFREDFSRRETIGGRAEK